MFREEREGSAELQRCRAAPAPCGSTCGVISRAAKMARESFNSLKRPRTKRRRVNAAGLYVGDTEPIRAGCVRNNFGVVFIIAFLMSVQEDTECYCESRGQLETLKSNCSSLDA